MRYIVSLFLFVLFSTPNHANANYQEEGNPNANIKVIQHSKSSLWSYLQDFIKTGKFEDAGDVTVEVTDSLSSRAVSGATVMLGDKEGQPFDGNVQKTNSEGKVVFNHESIRNGTFPLTIKKNGFSTFTLMNSSNGKISVSLQPLNDPSDFYFVEGKVTGFPSGVGSTYAELGVMVPAFRPTALMNFDVGQFISSYKVKINLFGEREVPGNLILPPQSKRYGLIPISLDKPEFIMPLAKGTYAHMSAIGGSISISDAYGAVNKKDYLSALNMMTVSHIGHTSSRLNIRKNTRFNLDLEKEIEQRSLISRLESVDRGLDAISVSLYDPKGDRGDFIPMDVKALKSEEFSSGSGKVKLGSLKRRRSSDDFYSFTGIFDREKFEDRNATERNIVGSLQRVNNRSMDARFNGFFKMIDAKSVSSSNRKYKFSSAENSRSRLKPNLVLLNLISEKTVSQLQGKVRNTLWSSVFIGDTQEIELPDLGERVLPRPSGDEVFYWEVTSIYTKANLENLDLQEALRSLEHVSTVSKKF
ncbi:MAG: hypothetical protein M9962_09110 [Oligoflexia bacterium]|nr:hypothetical protein [Oligoflexia bacterium]